MTDTRKGLNCVLFYPVGKNVRSFTVRVDAIGHGLTMIADESSARNARAYYPHRVAPSRFYIRVLLKGFGERKAFSDWLQGYADHVMNPGLAVGKKFPDMRVLVPARNFDRNGVPLTGFEWGDVIGGMLWTPTIVFETTGEPQDTDSWTTSKFVAAQDPDLKYFWPMGTQLGGNAVPSGNYNNIIDGSDGGSDSGQEPVPAPHDSGSSPSSDMVNRDDYGG
ncbi:hypothetical protein ACH4S8_37615 [Streptomyces sp. NPDC021080]|uniref:hypothetical protein n=1 Tax=Streptomyces sp. NPDC021080 TaxID=3365110 RepID=UPI0037913919